MAREEARSAVELSVASHHERTRKMTPQSTHIAPLLPPSRSLLQIWESKARSENSTADAHCASFLHTHKRPFVVLVASWCASRRLQVADTTTSEDSEKRTRPLISIASDHNGELNYRTFASSCPLQPPCTGRWGLSCRVASLRTVVHSPAGVCGPNRRSAALNIRCHQQEDTFSFKTRTGCCSYHQY